jgi:hypothetical protein
VILFVVMIVVGYLYVRALAFNPHFTTRHWATTEPFRDAATLEHFVDGYRKAGLPE